MTGYVENTGAETKQSPEHDRPTIQAKNIKNETRQDVKPQRSGIMSATGTEQVKGEQQHHHHDHHGRHPVIASPPQVEIIEAVDDGKAEYQLHKHDSTRKKTIYTEERQQANADQAEHGANEDLFANICAFLVDMAGEKDISQEVSYQGFTHCNPYGMRITWSLVKSAGGSGERNHTFQAPSHAYGRVVFNDTKPTYKLRNCILLFNHFPYVFLPCASSFSSLLNRRSDCVSGTLAACKRNFLQILACGLP